MQYGTRLIIATILLLAFNPNFVMAKPLINYNANLFGYSDNLNHSNLNYISDAYPMLGRNFDAFFLRILIK